MESPKVKAKLISTNLSRYGVEYPMQCGEIMDKARITNLRKYGVERPA